MDFAFSEEQDEFREVLRRFFEERSPLVEVRKAFASSDGFDRTLWKQMAGELGLQGVHLPEASGGQGFGFLELGIVLEEMGRALIPGPFFASSVLAAGAILAIGTPEQQAAWLPAIASGERIGALALVEATASWDPAAVQMLAESDAQGLLLSGTKHTVLSGDVADFFVVVVREPGTSGEAGIALAIVEAEAAGVSVTPQQALDLTRRQAEVRFDGARAVRLGTGGNAIESLRTLLRHAAVGLAAEAIGGGDRALEMAVEYAKARVQFARPIGSFQAVKHMAAEVLRDLELARAAAYWACWVAQEGTDQLHRAAPVAKASASDAFLAAATANIQIHGGIGFTWEHDAHLFYKRAKSAELLFGDSSEQRAVLATALGI